MTRFLQVTLGVVAIALGFAWMRGVRWNSLEHELPKKEATLGRASGAPKERPENSPAAPMTEHELQELELLLESETSETSESVEETLIIDGIPLMRVRGREITRDPETGSILITGITEILLIDGSIVEMAPDGWLSHDPKTGKTEANSSDTKFIAAPQASK